LEAANFAANLFNCIISGLPGRREFEAEKAGSFVFGDLAGNAQRLAGERAVLLRQDFRIVQDIHDRCILCHVAHDTVKTRTGTLMTDRTLDEDDIRWLEGYRSEVVKTYGDLFAKEADRFPDGEQLLRRFNEAVDATLKGASIRAAEEAHNELCIARALLLNTKLQFSGISYEPTLPGCAKSIDFRAVSTDGVTVFVDVKTIKPEPKDRWEQFERAIREEWFPANHNVFLAKEWLGGEIWHNMFAARARMMEYTLELEAKIRECGLTGRENTVFVLALCGDGFHWHEDGLEDFVQFYRSGRHRSDDHFAKAEAHFMEEESISFERTVTRFACMKRGSWETLPARLNWNVQAPRDPEFDGF
jgi:hypothetical protein